LAIGSFLGPAVSLGPTQYEQKQGPAVLRVEGDKLDDGHVEVRLSSKLRVTLSVEGPATLKVEQPANLTLSKHWKTRQVGEPEIEHLPDARVRWQLVAFLEPELVDGLPLQGKPLNLPLQIAPLRYRLDQSKENWQEAKWREVSVRVTTTVNKPELSELRDIPGPEQLPPVPRSPWIPVLYISGLALIGLAVALELKRRFTRSQPEIPPHEWAARELARLEGLGLPQHGQADRYHTLVSDTIRRYLELRFQLRAPRQTTAEFLEAMRQSPHLNADQRELLRGFLERCDLAKFARAEYSVPDCQATGAMAQSFVEQTKPAPEPVAAAPIEGR
jgi:hypothetical protein